MNEPSQTKCKFQSMRFKASDVLNLKAELDYQTVMQKLKKRTIPELKEVLAESRASSHFHNVFESVIPTITLMAIIPIMQAIPVKQFTNELYKMIVPIVIMAYIATAAIILILNFGKILKKNINFSIIAAVCEELIQKKTTPQAGHAGERRTYENHENGHR